MIQSITRYGSAVLLLLVAAQAAAAPVPKALPAGGAAVLPEDALASLELLDDRGGAVSLRVEPAAPGIPFTQQVRLDVQPTDAPANPITLACITGESISRGDVLLLRLWVRPASKDAQGTFVFQQSHEPFAVSMTTPWRAQRPGWRCVDIPFTAKTNLPAGQARVALRLDDDVKTTTVAGVQLLNYGKSLTLHELIRRIGRGELMVDVKDKRGQPITDANVQIEMAHTVFGFPVAPDEPMFEGIAAAGGPFGVPHMVVLKPLEGDRVGITDTPDGAVVTTFNPGVNRTRGRNPLSGVPKRLRQLQCITIDRGDRDRPGRGYRFTVDRPVEAYLFVHDRGRPTLDAGWRRTPTSATWTSGDWTITDLIYKKRFDAGPITVAPHNGSDQPPWWTSVRGSTNNAGLFTSGAYHGTYRIKVKHGRKTKAVHAELLGDRAVVTVTLD